LGPRRATAYYLDCARGGEAECKPARGLEIPPADRSQ
jgi:hypothetical protein